MTLVEDYPDEKLYEYLGLEKTEMGTSRAGKSATLDHLHAQLLLNRYIFDLRGLSSAIFWTSQGLNVLGQGIEPGFKGIQGCSEPPPPNTTCKKPKPPRNAVYVFVGDGEDFDPPTDVTQYLQCFNIKPPSRLPGGSKYYCSRTGNLPSPDQVDDITSLRGEICDTTKLGEDCEMVP